MDGWACPLSNSAKVIGFVIGFDIIELVAHLAIHLLLIEVFNQFNKKFKHLGSNKDNDRWLKVVR